MLQIRMTEQLQRRLEETLHEQFSGTDHVAVSKLRDAELPNGIQHFLVRSLQRRIQLEAREALESLNGWIDTDHEPFNEIVGDTADALLVAARYPEKEWNRACSQAISALLAYLQEPARALADFAYPAGMTSVPANDLRRRMGYFEDYPYMSRAVDAWLEQRATNEIDRPAFESAMHHLDVRMTEDHGVEEWVALLQPMIDLSSYAGIEPAGLPVPMVGRFFEAKRRPVLAALVRQAAAVHGSEMITVPSLKEIIEKGLENERFHESQGETSRSTSAAPSSSTKVPAASAPSQNQDVNPDQPLPLWKRFQKQTEHNSAGNPTAEKTPESQPLWKSFESSNEQQLAQSRPQPQEEPPAGHPEPSGRPAPEFPIQEAPRLESQHIVLGTAVRSRERFIHALFDKNESMYREVMDVLAEAPDWSSASSIIAERVFKPHRIDIYSDVAVDFTNAVEARYSGMPS